MITQADIDTFKSMGKATTKAVADSYEATLLSRSYHAEYVKALKLSNAAFQACDDWYSFCQGFGKAAQGNNYWFKAAYEALSKIGPARAGLENDRKLLLADMAAHSKYGSGTAPASQEAAAADADKQAAKSGRSVPKSSGPKGTTPSLDPTAEEPVDRDETELSTGAKVGIAAALGAALLWIARKVL